MKESVTAGRVNCSPSLLSPSFPFQAHSDLLTFGDENPATVIHPCCRTAIQVTIIPPRNNNNKLELKGTPPPPHPARKSQQSLRVCHAKHAVSRPRLPAKERNRGTLPAATLAIYFCHLLRFSTSGICIVNLQILCTNISQRACKISPPPRCVSWLSG